MRGLVLIAGLLAVESAVAQEFSCRKEKYCGDMRSCSEAVYHLRQCRFTRRDSDGDGIPCESICGKTRQVMDDRLRAEGSFTPAPGLAASAFAAPVEFSCRVRKTCGQMASCDEARFHLKQCGNRRLDGNRDGIPCNGLCRGR